MDAGPRPAGSRASRTARLLGCVAPARARRPRRAARIALALLASALATVGPVPPAVAAPLTATTYEGPAYSPALGAPTRPESQSKLWFHAGAWWALLLEPTGRTVRVFELMPDHTWRPTSAVVTTDAGDIGDALHDGDTVHVANRHGDGSLYYVRLTFDPATRDYRADPPRLVGDHGGRSAATIAKDTTGRLWIGYATSIRIVVAYSDDGLTWSANIALSVRVASGPSEMAALVSYDDRVGILWSDQLTGSFEFASHRDGDDPAIWTREQALVGAGLADDHVSLRRVDGEAGDTLVAAIKTSQGDVTDAADAPLIEVLVRTPDGRWTSVPVSTVGDGLNDPVLTVDPGTRTLHLFASRRGSIVTKQASLDDLSFPTGIGSVFLTGAAGGVFNPTTAKEPVDPTSGLVVLASDITAKGYRHAEAPIGDGLPPAVPGDGEPPATPAQLRARALSPDSVALSWAAVVDADRWAPGQDGAPAAQYAVLRNGVEIATVVEPLFRDRVPDDVAAARPASVEYAVLAVDQAGNRSEAATTVVELPAADEGVAVPVWVPVAAGVGLLVAGGGYLVVRRRRLFAGV